MAKLKRKFYWLITGSIIILIFNMAFADLVFADSYLPKGIYAMVKKDTQVDSQILNHPDITGLHIRAVWSTLEPSNNVFNWSYFDGLIAQAKSKNKKVSIAVLKGLIGEGLPSWLSVSLFTCSDGSQGPIPWDTTHKKEWIELWTEIAKRYENEPTVSMYHIGGIYSWHTADWDLCDASSTDRNNWLSAGYQVEKIQTFALEFTSALSNATKKPFILPIAGTMDNSGEISTDITTNDFIIKPLFDLYGPSSTIPQFGIMRTVFSENTPDPLGFWNTNPLGGQFGTLYSWRPNIAGQVDMGSSTLDTVRTMIDISLHYEIQFMELRSAQILILGIEDDIHCYNRALGTSGTHCVHDTTPPIISNVASSNITANSAIITWTTDEPADSRVEYGLNTTYGNSTPFDSQLLKNHTATLNGLVLNTLYHYRVISKDANENLSISEDFTLLTILEDTTPPAAPTGVTVS